MALLSKIGRPEKFNAVTLAEILASYAGFHLLDIPESERLSWIDKAQYALDGLVREASIS